MAGARIVGIVGHLPERVETNEELARDNPDWDLPRIADKTGIQSRRIAAPGETACDLGFEAARRLMARELVPPAEIDYVLMATQTPDHLFPSNACLLQSRLGLGNHVGAFDFNHGCSGFVCGLQLATALIKTQMARNVLLVTADTYSKLVHPRDRTVRALFGDGAAATLIGPTGEVGGEVDHFVVGTDGSGSQQLTVPSGGFRLPRSAETAVEFEDDTGCLRSQDHLFMDGGAIFSFALNTVPRAVTAVLEHAGLTPDDVDWYVYHQANKFMLENLAMCSRIPEAKMVYHLETVGNTVSASIPLAIQAYVESERIQPGQRLMLAGFGVGLSWAVCQVVWS
jgi:3-oxoacyl-[acyl-carrier-protein] synthase-3